MIVRFVPEELNNGDRILADFLREQEVRLILPCGGNGTCGRCSVKICCKKNDKVIKRFEALSCKTRLSDISGDFDCIEIHIPDDQIEKSDKHRVNIEKRETGMPWLAATDLGSTTIETAALTPDGEVIGSVSRANPQRTYGADVISRIRAASESVIAASDMQRLAESTIQSEIQELYERYGLASKPLTLAIAGNTTMGHLLTGDDVAPLGQAPYDAGDISLQNISSVFYNDNTPVYLLPGISAYVGADIVSGIYYLGIDESPEVSMLIDLGTNGEMALGNRDELLVTSTAAGPAFEAANISCGCAVVPGAISAVNFYGKTTHLTLIPWQAQRQALSPAERMRSEVALKLKRPAGVCGSGLISAAAAMKKAGIIDENGTYTKDEWIKNGFPIWKPSPANRGESDIRLTQDDIHELLMAKSAIASGIEILLSTAGTLPSRVYLAGGFGDALAVNDAIDIGLFPDILKDTQIIPAGNTSLKGAEVFLTDTVSAAARFSRIRNISTEIRLSDAADFQKLYISNMKI